MKTKHTQPETASVSQNLVKWKKGTFKVAVKPNYWREVNGYTSGLFGIEKERWNVTHLPSGYKMPGYFARLKDAEAYVEQVLPLTDWTTVTPINACDQLQIVKDGIKQAMEAFAI